MPSFSEFLTFLCLFTSHHPEEYAHHYEQHTEDDVMSSDWDKSSDGASDDSYEEEFYVFNLRRNTGRKSPKRFHKQANGIKKNKFCKLSE